MHGIIRLPANTQQANQTRKPEHENKKQKLKLDIFLFFQKSKTFMNFIF